MVTSGQTGFGGEMGNIEIKLRTLSVSLQLHVIGI